MGSDPDGHGNSTCFISPIMLEYKYKVNSLKNNSLQIR